MTSVGAQRRAPTRRRRWTILAICALALFLVGLDTTIVTVGLPQIGEGLGVEANRLAWVVDAYTLPFASLLITSGALADRYGRRRVFQSGLVVFGLASLMCAAAPSLEVLIAARAVQGVGASMLTPVALSIVVNAMPDPRERARAIGVWGAVFGLSMAAGPIAGGALIAAFDWRAVFWSSAPVVAAALLLTAWLVPESRSAVPRRLDLPGQLLLTASLAAGVGILIEGPHLGWSAPPMAIAYVVLLAAVVGLGIVESRRAAPLVEPALFRVVSFTAAILAAIIVFVAFSTTLLLTTTLLQQEGWSPLAAGAATLPMAATATACAPLSGHLVSRVGARPLLLTAGGCLIVGGALLTSLVADTRLPLLFTAYVAIGAGLGFANAPITNTAIDGLPPERAGGASAMASTARQVGTAVGIALAGSLVASARDSGGLAGNLLPGWVWVAACGAGVLLCALAAPSERAPRPGPPGRSGAG